MKTIITKNLDKLLHDSNFENLEHLFDCLNSSSILAILNEKERFKNFIKKRDFIFINKFLNFLKEKVDEDSSRKIFNNKVYTEKIKRTVSGFEVEPIYFSVNNKNSKLLFNTNTKKYIDFTNKIYQHITFEESKKNTSIKLIGKLINFSKKHNIKSTYDDFFIRLGYLIDDKNLSVAIPLILGSGLITNNKEKQNFICSIFENTSNFENLNFLLKNFETNIRQGFNEKIDNHLFWKDFSFSSSYTNPFFGTHLTETHINKMVFLEKNNLGYSNSEMPYYLDFLRKLNSEEVITFLNTVNSEKYYSMINKDLLNYKQKTNPFINDEESSEKFNKLIEKMEETHRDYILDENFTLLEKIEVLILKNNLDLNLSNKDNPVKKLKI